MIKLSKKNYDLLKSINLSEIGSTISFDDKEMVFETSNLRLLEEIVTKGMKNQEMVSEYRRELYALYDEILEKME